MRSVWPISYIKRKREERIAQNKEGASADKAARVTATATKWMAVFTCFLTLITGGTLVVLKLQLREMHTGGVDTHDLAVAAGNQANRMKDLSDRMQDQAARTKDLADRMKDQADQTKTIATQAIVQADAAKDAADIAKEALHISERAYLILGGPVDDFQHKITNVPIINSGHIPSGPTQIIVHEITFKIADVSAKTVPFEAVLERHWRIQTYQTIPVVLMGNLMGLEVHLPAVNQDDIASGKQGVLIAAVVTYNDGFPNTPEQIYTFCDGSSYTASTKLFKMRPCDDPTTILSTLTALDKYPTAEYEEK